MLGKKSRPRMIKKIHLEAVKMVGSVYLSEKNIITNALHLSRDLT